VWCESFLEFGLRCRSSFHLGSSFLGRVSGFKNTVGFFLKSPKFGGIGWVRFLKTGTTKEIGTGHQKINTVHQKNQYCSSKNDAKIRFGHLRFFPLRQIFEH
jgi:hypothetical protein